MTLYENIKARRLFLKLSQRELADKLGYKSTSTIAKIESGKNDIPQSKIKAFADALETTPGSLMGYTPPIKEYSNISSIEKKQIPMLGKISCGKPIMAEEIFDGYVQCGSHVHVDFCLKAQGDSMINARIYDGDIVFIKQQPEVENGEIAAVSIDDEVTLKRVYIGNGSIELRAENPKYKPIIVRENEYHQIRILGKAVAFQGEVI